MINLKLSPNQLIEIIKKGYSLDLLAILQLIRQEVDLNAFCGQSAKMNSLQYVCIRKGLCTEDHKITVEGKQLLEFLSTEAEEPKLPKKKDKNEPIEAFWKVFPATDKFEHKGKKFEGSRALRTSKEDCKVKLAAILNEGEYSIEQIIKAVEFDVLQKKEQSVKTGQNKLTYIQNSLTYIRQRSFEPFIELISQGETVKVSP